MLSMLFKKILFFQISIIMIFIISCQKEKKHINTEKKEIKNIDSLRQVTLMKYLSIPKSLDTLIYYSDFDEIIKNLNVIEKYSYDDYSKELIKIARFKCYILYGNFDSSKEELSHISNELDYNDLKNFYFGIYNFFKKDSIKSNQFFKAVHSSMVKDNIKDINCFQVALVAKLSNNKIDTTSCNPSIKNNISKSLFGKTKREVILKEIMGVIEF